MSMKNKARDAARNGPSFNGGQIISLFGEVTKSYTQWIEWKIEENEVGVLRDGLCIKKKMQNIFKMDCLFYVSI